jgi:poly-gamma-glutamate capsule biosynthesis protein CapA/YwtB (metallophosphatase superfamily)
VRGAVLTLAVIAAAVMAMPAPAAAQAVTISWVGDMSFSRKHGLPRDPHSVFAPVRSSLAADLVTGNLEGTLGRGGPSKCGGGRPNCHAFQAPASYAGVFARAGFEMLNMANNHSRDFGTSGLRQTQAALKGAGIARTGLRGQLRVMEANGVRVAFLGYAPYEWAGPLLDIGQARGEIRRARRQRLAAREEVAAAASRADVVIVFIHAGAEGSGATHVPHGREVAFGENRGETRRFARTMIDAGADAVLGSGPHVLRGIQCHRGRPIAYSLGNFAGYNTLSTAGVLALSGVVRVRIGKDGSFLGGRLVPVTLRRPGVPRLDPKRRSIALVRRLSRADFGRNRCRMGADGKFNAP